MDERQFNAFMVRLSQMLNEIRQYVGARYVPRFIDGGWDATQAYEALDVVDNGQGTSYIAKKPVPAGTPLTNREYWFVYGSTSGAIINLQNQIDAIVNNTIPGINSSIQALTNQFNKADNPFKNSTFLFMGDSFASTSGWVTRFGQLCNGATIINQTEGGRTFVGDNTYISKLTAYVEGETTDILESIDYLILLGGIGDSHPESNSTLNTKITEFITYAQAHLPNAKIYLGYIGGGLCGYGGVGDPGSATPIQRLRAMYTYHDVATQHNAFYISGINNILNNYRWYLGDGMDGLHPKSSSGIGWVIAEYLYNYLATGSASYYVADTATATVGSSNNVKFDMFQSNNDTEVRIGKFNCTLSGAIGQQGEDVVKLCTLPNACPIWGSYLVNMDLMVYDGSNDGLAPLSFFIYKHELYVTSIQRQTPGAWWNIPTGSKIEVPELVFKMDTAMTLIEKYNKLG